MNERQTQEEHDRLVDSLEQRIKSSGKYDCVLKHHFYSKGSDRGEADLVALYKNTLVYFEVKLHENESSLYSARKQIERFKRCYNLTRVIGVYFTPTCVRRVY